MRHLRFTAAFILAAFVAGSASAATVVIQNNDGAGEGFNDPTPIAPVGGNPGTTVGAQRLNAFTYAANLWGARLSSSVTILVRAQMDPQTCTATAAVLGSAGTLTVFRDFANAPVSATWYCQALANARAGTDLDPANPDINATFNSNLNGSAGCLGGKKWYYGYDSTPPGSDIDFISVVTHEIGHGLGFQTFVSQAGAKFNTFNDQYMIKLDQSGAVPSTYSAMSDAQRAAANISDPNLRWMGTNVDTYAAGIPVTAGLSNGHVRMHAPNPYVSGSSVSHFSTAVTPNEIMEPSYTGPNHNIELSLQLFKDEGWTVIAACSPGITTVNDVDTLTVHRQPSNWDLKVKVKNTGAFAANTVSATMYGGPAWLGITDPGGSYPNLAAGASAFNTDTYSLDLTNWPGGAFQVNLQVNWTDNCGTNRNQILTVDLQPSPVVAVAISSFHANLNGGAVRLDATFRSDLGATGVNIYRGVGNGPLLKLGAGTPLNDAFHYDDTTVQPGTSYRYRIGVVDADGEFMSGVQTVVTPNAPNLLAQNHPNPFNPATTIQFSLAVPGVARLAIYNADGKLVRLLVDGMQQPGTHTVDWNGRDDHGASVSSGVYFYRLTAGSFTESRKMVLLK